MNQETLIRLLKTANPMPIKKVKDNSPPKDIQDLIDARNSKSSTDQ